jgi:hypothetical protein
MKKLCLLLAFNLLWMIPAPASADPSNAKAGVLAPGAHEWTTVEITGMLDYDDGGLRPRIPEFGAWIGYSVTADGKWFGMDFLGNKEQEKKAKNLTGKRVLVKGYVEERTLEGFIPLKIKVVVVSDLEPALEARESVTIQLTGKFEVNAMVTYLYRVPVITVNGQMYVIDYEGAEAVFAEARKLDGKMVVLTGTPAGELSFPVMCRPENVRLPVIQLRSVQAADEKAKDAIALNLLGKLERVPRDPIDPGFDVFGHPTGWVIHVNGRTYAAAFADDKMQKLAGKLDGRRVRLCGILKKETRTIGLGPTDGLIQWEEEILHVSELAAADGDSVKEIVHVEVVGELEMVNLLGPPPAEGWSIKTDKQTYHLKFDANIPKEKPESLLGKSVIVTGERVDDLTILVSGLRLAGDR